MSETFIAAVGKVNARREISVIHGKVLGANIGVTDVDEGRLLQVEPDRVFQQLGVILGFDIEQMILGTRTCEVFLFTFLTLFKQF